ncbi:MAG TPA: response regulator [Phototrophicaceae bacterium]|nr:response regulator [Phototrophicaceae bacterium]
MSLPENAPRVLIVDDEAANVTILDRLFRSEYRTATASNGQIALDLLERESFDLVLLDIMMPIVSGLEVLRHIRENPRTTDLPVILISARLDENDIVEGLTIGASDYVTKPFRFAELRARARTQITLKRLQDERKHTIDQLSAAHELKDRIFRIASHDLKNPISNLHIINYLVRKHVGEDAQMLDLLNSAEANLDTMQAVINEFLDVAALQNGKIDLRPENVSVETVVNDLLKQYHLTALKKNIEIEAHVSGMIRGDAGRYAQALGNLISNALKYSPKDTSIAISTEVRGEYLRICVADHGPGIPADERNQLFTQFGKLSTRPTDGESSTGLGLWIVKHLTTLQGGEVGVEMPTGGGSIFWIEMPAVVSQPVAVAVPKPLSVAVHRAS